jgi:hypothetical protein
MTSLSKAIALYGSLEWGLRDIEFLSPHSFRCNHGEFLCRMWNHEDAQIFVEWLEDERDDWYVVYIIPNKVGDNCVLFKSADIAEMSNKWISFEWIAKKYKKKWRIDYHPSTSAT